MAFARIIARTRWDPKSHNQSYSSIKGCHSANTNGLLYAENSSLRYHVSPATDQPPSHATIGTRTNYFTCCYTRIQASLNTHVIFPSPMVVSTFFGMSVVACSTQGRPACQYKLMPQKILTWFFFVAFLFLGMGESALRAVAHHTHPPKRYRKHQRAGEDDVYVQGRLSPRVTNEIIGCGSHGCVQ